MYKKRNINNDIVLPSAIKGNFIEDRTKTMYSVVSEMGNISSGKRVPPRIVRKYVIRTKIYVSFARKTSSDYS